MNFIQYITQDSRIVPVNSIVSYDNNIIIDKIDLKLSGRLWRLDIPRTFFELVDKQTISIYLERVYYERYLFINYTKGQDHFYIRSRRYLRNYNVSLLLIGQLWGTQEVYNCRKYVEEQLNEK